MNLMTTNLTDARSFILADEINAFCGEDHAAHRLFWLEASEILEAEDALIPSAEQSRGPEPEKSMGGERHCTLFFLGTMGR